MLTTKICKWQYYTVNFPKQFCVTFFKFPNQSGDKLTFKIIIPVHLEETRFHLFLDFNNIILQSWFGNYTA